MVVNTFAFSGFHCTFQYDGINSAFLETVVYHLRMFAPFSENDWVPTLANTIDHI